MGVSIPWMNWGELRARAREFLERHHPDRTLPVPIEMIVERLGIDIVPVPGLLDPEGRGINGYLCADTRTLYVDDWLYSHVETRYHFTLAHELAHLVLHPEHYKKFRNHEDWLSFHRDLSAAAIASAEWQADFLAGLILVPEDSLRPVAKACFDELAALVLAADPDFDLCSDAFSGTLADFVARSFAVSNLTARIRLQNDGLWGKRL